MIYLCLADGFEEIEALAPVDLLRRVGKEIRIVGIGTATPASTRGVKVVADMRETETDFEDMEMLILPGGAPGYQNLLSCPRVEIAARRAAAEHIPLAAICAAPTVLGRWGLLHGKRACCYPGMEEDLHGGRVSFDAVCVDGNVITSRGAGTAIPFALTLVETLCGKTERDRLAKSIVFEG